MGVAIVLAIIYVGIVLMLGLDGIARAIRNK